ncbi:hypothetical protein Amet_3981 [Alkaliphilus metalliredigens QYMF]|uniref:Uncharacterized protein n=1 Tax=Alkaliphilus metalliredigens (strain QYMF) TaxID=293826 RepID=A6TV48_ALKMQ|nr:hypothetical protein [Alkaliphilus metalliredigens]ABR50066.1 hypothetical protein Amet_3981 [Alkaliphilus metalliredigens QYMF]
MTDKKKLQEKFRKRLYKPEDANKSEIIKERDLQANEESSDPQDSVSLSDEKVTRLDAVPKRRIDDRQNYKKTDQKIKQKKKFSTEGRYKQKQHSIKRTLQNKRKPSKLKKYENKASQKVDQRTSNSKGTAGVMDKDKVKTQFGSEKRTLNKHKTQKAHEFNKKKLHQKAMGVPYAI